MDKTWNPFEFVKDLTTYWDILDELLWRSWELARQTLRFTYGNRAAAENGVREIGEESEKYERHLTFVTHLGRDLLQQAGGKALGEVKEDYLRRAVRDCICVSKQKTKLGDSIDFVIEDVERCIVRVKWRARPRPDG